MVKCAYSCKERGFNGCCFECDLNRSCFQFCSRYDAFVCDGIDFDYKNCEDRQNDSD